MKFWLQRIAIGALILIAYFGYSSYEENRLKQALAQDIGDPAISIRFIEHSLVLEGTVSDQGKKDRAEILAKTYIKGLHLRNFLQHPEIVNLIDLQIPARKSASAEQ